VRKDDQRCRDKTNGVEIILLGKVQIKKRFHAGGSNTNTEEQVLNVRDADGWLANAGVTCR
jgi:hypothetical protein